MKTDLLTVQKRFCFCGSFLLIVFCVCLCFTVLSVPSSFVVTYLEMTDLFALLCVMFFVFLSLSHMVSGSGMVT